MRIHKVELYHIQMPLNFVFKTSRTSLNHRETLVLKAMDTLGNTGYGEVVAFREPFYSKETLQDAKEVLLSRYIPEILKREIKHPFDLHQWLDQTYPMAKAGLENALLDLYAKSRKQPVMKAVFAEETRDWIEPGMVLGDLDTSAILQQIDQYRQEGYRRFKIKIKPADGYLKAKLIREHYPDIQLLADANRSYGRRQIDELKKFDDLELLCIEEPLDSMNFYDYRTLQQEIRTPICLDESIETLEDLKTAIRLKACNVVNIKIGRVGGLYYAKQMIERCRENQVHYWIGSMLESGISKILHVHLASLKDTYIPGDLSPSRRYFPKDLIYPEIAVENGRILVPQGWGSGVEINEDVLNEYSIDRAIRGGGQDELD